MSQCVRFSLHLHSEVAVSPMITERVPLHWLQKKLSLNSSQRSRSRRGSVFQSGVRLLSVVEPSLQTVDDDDDDDRNDYTRPCLRLRPLPITQVRLARPCSRRNARQPPFPPCRPLPPTSLPSPKQMHAPDPRMLRPLRHLPFHSHQQSRARRKTPFSKNMTVKRIAVP